MIPRKQLIIVTLLLLPKLSFASSSACTPKELRQHPEQVLSCYMQESGDITAKVELINKKVLADNVTHYLYRFDSLRWPIPTNKNATTLWQHQLDLYVPAKIKSDQALLNITGGINRPLPGKQQLPATSDINMVKIAATSHTVTATLTDIPNQFLDLGDQVPRREDGIVAYTWNQYMDAPGHNAYWPAHLPMAKAAILAMDTIQKIASEQRFEKKPEHFVVTGQSKRGLAAWFTVLGDNKIAKDNTPRVNGLIPVVIDTLNTQQVITHIYRSLNKWPRAFHDYVGQHITNPKRLCSDNFRKLMSIEDPYQYIHNTTENYRRRLAIPKYIISASSDEFFPPDASALYVSNLPGKNVQRIFANQDHHINQTKLTDAINNFYQYIVNNRALPVLTWEQEGPYLNIQVKSKYPPVDVTAWQAYNPKARDFRRDAKDPVSYQQISLKPQSKPESDGLFHFKIPLSPKAHPNEKSGWRATFAVLHFANGNLPISISTPAVITPKTFPGPAPCEEH